MGPSTQSCHQSCHRSRGDTQLQRLERLQPLAATVALTAPLAGHGMVKGAGVVKWFTRARPQHADLQERARVQGVQGYSDAPRESPQVPRTGLPLHTLHSTLLCDTCREPLATAAAAGGFTTHPACGASP